MVQASPLLGFQGLSLALGGFGLAVVSVYRV